MSYNPKELTVVRDLAKQYAEVALSDKHVRMRKRFRDSNDLKIAHPPLIMEEIPWHEMNHEGALDCICEDEVLCGMEYVLRRELYREKYFKCDNYIEPFWVIRKEITETVKVCQKYGCPLDITLKDISTVGYKPENLMVWAKTVSDVLDEYYGEE